MPGRTIAHNKVYKVIIVGSGPAGISTALHLARRAPELVPETLILEKARHPRPKLCGGGVLPDGEVVLRRLGLDLTEIAHVDVDWARFDFNGRGMSMRASRALPYAFRTIQRDEFDAWLAGKARACGFTILEDTRVQGLRVENGYVCVETERGAYRARVAVGADGSNSTVRQASMPRQGPRPARLLEVYTPAKPEASAHIQSDSYFDFFSVPAGISGYVWDFPALVKGELVRCRGIFDASHVRRAAPRPLKEVLAEELRRHGQDLDRYRLAGHPLRWFEARGPFSAPHILLAGDAAGADALYGEGISIALGYGKIAAEAICDAFQRDDFTFEDYRRRILRDPLGIALRRRTFFSKAFYRLTSAGIQALLWRRMGGLVEWVMQHFMLGWADRQKE